MSDRRDFFKTLGLGALATVVAPKVLSAETKEVAKTTFKVRAKVNIYHGVTNQLTCKEGDIFTVVDIQHDPECADFKAIGVTPAPGKWYQFKETGEQIHRAVLFEEVKEEKPQEYYHFEKPISDYDRETYRRLDELVKRK